MFKPNVEKLKIKGKLKALIKALEYKDPKVRKEAAEALGELGDFSAVDPLIKALKDSKQEVRKIAVEKLGQFADTRAVEPLIEILRSRKYEAKAAAKSLGQIGDVRAYEPLIWVSSKYGKRDDDMRNAAVLALGELGDVRAVDILIAKLNDDKVCQDAVKALVKLGSPAVNPLLNTLMKEKVLPVQGAIIDALGQLGDTKAVEPLIAMLKIKSPGNEYAVKNKCIAAKALGKLGDTSALLPLINALADEDINVRNNVAVALDELGWKAENHDFEAFYYIAKQELNRCNLMGSTAVKPLLITLKKLNTQRNYSKQASLLRVAIIKTLVQMGEVDIEPLIGALADIELCSISAEILAQLGDLRAVNPLIVMLENNKKWIAAKVLGELGDARAISALVLALDFGDKPLRDAAAYALIKLGDFRGVEPLIEIMNDENRLSPRKRAAEELARFVMKNPDSLSIRWNKIKMIAETLHKDHYVHSNDCNASLSLEDRHYDQGIGISFPDKPKDLDF